MFTNIIKLCFTKNLSLFSSDRRHNTLEARQPGASGRPCQVRKNIKSFFSPFFLVSTNRKVRIDMQEEKGKIYGESEMFHIFRFPYI